jgi:DNA (cytosine-5)-methyltransferase 1
VVAIDRAAFNQGQNAQYDPQFYTDGTVPTLVARGPSAVAHKAKEAVAYVDTTHADDVVRLDDTVAPLQARDYKGGKLVQIHYIVRRLTPTECARLQGFADRWGDIEEKTDFTDEEYAFWLDVRNTHAAINGKAVKEYTKAQMLTWYNKLHTDSAEYKMWGNGIALPTALYCMQGIAEAMR